MKITIFKSNPKRGDALASILGITPERAEQLERLAHDVVHPEPFVERSQAEHLPLIAEACNDANELAFAMGAYWATFAEALKKQKDFMRRNQSSIESLLDVLLSGYAAEMHR